MAENAIEKIYGKIEDKDGYVHKAYEDALTYYYKSGARTKRSYKLYRFLSIFLGALVTLISSLAATRYVESVSWLSTIFDIGTPVIAATLTIITGLSQSFQWGSTWRETMVNAQKIKGERDRFLATDPQERDHLMELENLNGIVMEETEAFFQRVLDSQTSTFPSSSKVPKDNGG